MSDQLFIRPSTAPISLAVQNLTSSTKWYVENDYDISTFVWEDDAGLRPSDEVIIAEQQRLYSVLMLDDVRQKRAPEYPSIGDQLDALWKGGEAAAEMLAKVQAVKAKYPKPTE